ncbi:MAG: type II toxin-antitoxin system HicB family antitoxin, partial [Candidatus Micrarchaeia archaeon]
PISMKDYTIIIEQGEDGYLISEVLELPGCHTQAKTLDELMKRTREAIKIYVGTTSKEPSPSTFLGIQKLAV